MAKKLNILVMELIILAILEAQSKVLTSPSLHPTSLHIRLLQSSQVGEDHRRRCVASTYEECKQIREHTKLEMCVSYKFVRCIALIEISSKGYFLRFLYRNKVRRAIRKCGNLCFNKLKNPRFHIAYCLVDCYDELIWNVEYIPDSILITRYSYVIQLLINFLLYCKRIQIFVTTKERALAISVLDLENYLVILL